MLSSKRKSDHLKQWWPAGAVKYKNLGPDGLKKGCQASEAVLMLRPATTGSDFINDVHYSTY